MADLKVFIYCASLAEYEDLVYSRSSVRNLDFRKLRSLKQNYRRHLERLLSSKESNQWSGENFMMTTQSQGEASSTCSRQVPAGSSWKFVGLCSGSLPASQVGPNLQHLLRHAGGRGSLMKLASLLSSLLAPLLHGIDLRPCKRSSTR